MKKPSWAQRVAYHAPGGPLAGLQALAAMATEEQTNPLAALNDPTVNRETAELLHRQRDADLEERDRQQREVIAENIRQMNLTPSEKAGQQWAAETIANLEAQVQHRKDSEAHARRMDAAKSAARELVFGPEAETTPLRAPAVDPDPQDVDWDLGTAKRAAALIRAYERKMLQRVNLLRQARNVGRALLSCAPPTVNPRGSLSEMLSELRQD